MAKKWSEVAASPEFQALSPADKAAAQQEYFSSVVAPQLDNPNDVADARKEFLASTSPSLGAKAADFGKQVIEGTMQGAVGLAGLPGSLGQAYDHASSFISSLPVRAAEKLGLVKSGTTDELMADVNKVGEGFQGPSDKAGNTNTVAGVPLMTAKPVVEAFGNATGGYAPPQTSAGEYGNRIGQFVGGMAAGPVGTGREAIRNVLQYGVAPAVASQATHNALEGSSLQPYAETAAALMTPSIPNAARAIVTPNSMSAARQAAVDALQNEGVNALTAGQRTGNKNLQYLESAAGESIGGAQSAAERNAATGEQFTRAALSRVGENAPRATPDVIDNAFNRIGGEFNDIGSRNTLRIDRQATQDVLDAQADYHRTVAPHQRVPVVDAAVNQIMTDLANGGTIPGDVYIARRSQLAADARAMQDPYARNALNDLVGSLDDAMARSVNPQDAQRLATARRQYRNLMVMEDAATRSGTASQGGVLTPAALYNAVKNQSRRALSRGQGDYADLAHAGMEVLTPLPNSGTAGRSHANATLSAIGAALGGGLGHYAGGETTNGAILGAAAGQLAGSLGRGAAARAVLSRPVQGYLGNQLLAARNFPQTSTGRDALMRALLASHTP